MLKHILKFLLVTAATFFVMIRLANIFPSLQTNFFGFAIYSVPLIIATISVCRKSSTHIPNKGDTVPIYDLESLTQEEGTPVIKVKSLIAPEEENRTLTINTHEEMMDFLRSHVLVRSFITKVVGVSYDNDDGTSRQEILSCCMRGEPVIFHWHLYEGKPACAVISDHGQIGHLSADLAADLDRNYDSDEYYFAGQISDITGGADGLYYGCNIILSIYGSSN